jgi:hypothetical protein
VPVFWQPCQFHIRKTKSQVATAFDQITLN